MGASICCRRPDEIIIEEYQYPSGDNNQLTAIDQNSSPEDTERKFKSNDIIDDKNKNQEISNQKLYEQEVNNSKNGGEYEVAINASGNQNNEEENKTNNMTLSHKNEKSQNINEEQQEIKNVVKINMNYEDLVNQIGNDATLNVFKNDKKELSQQNNLNLNNDNKQEDNTHSPGAIDLRIFEPNYVNLKFLPFDYINNHNPNLDRKNQYIFDNDDLNEPHDANIINQNNINNNEINQEVKTTSQLIINENNNSNQYIQQVISKILSENKEIENEDNLISNKEKEEVDLKQLTINNNDKPQRDLNTINNQNVQKNENISKEKEVKRVSLEPMDRVSKNKKNNENIHMKYPSDSDINNVTQKIERNVDLNNIKIDMNNLNIENKDLPEVFGSSDINNFKKFENMTTTNEIGNINTHGLSPNIFIKEDRNINVGNNLNQINTESKGISIGNNQLSSNVNNVIKDENIITATVTKEDPKDINLNRYFKNTNYQQQLNLNNIGKNVNSISNANTGLNLQSLGLNTGQITSTNPTSTQIGAMGNMNPLGGIDLNNLGYNKSQQFTTANNLVNLGVPNPSISISSSYPIPTSVVNNTSSYNNFPSPTQSYSYNYSYNMPSVG